MRFLSHKRRSPPSVIIVSLIDVLMVVLIFLMVSTTFKQQPAVKLALPESKQAKTGVSESGLVVTIARQAPHIYLDTRPVTIDKLQTELTAAAARNPQVSLSIRADTEAPFGQIVKVMDAAKAANVRSVNAFIRGIATP